MEIICPTIKVNMMPILDKNTFSHNDIDAIYILLGVGGGGGVEFLRLYYLW